MKVLFLVNIPSPYRVDFFDELGKLCDLTVLYELKEASDRDSSWYGDNSSGNYKYEFLKPVFKLTSAAYCPSVKKYLKAPSYDVIVVGGYSTPTGMLAIRYLRSHKRPFILNCDGGMVPESESRFKYGFKHYFISCASVWLSPSGASDDYLKHYGAREKEIYRFPFTSLYKADIIPGLSEPSQRAAGINFDAQNPAKIISVGNYIRRKGFDVLIKAMEYVKVPAVLKIVGGTATDEYVRLKENCERANPLVKIEFESFKDKKTLFEMYRDSDLFVLATRYDIWGLVVGEAMACGLPVITTNACNAGVELVHEGENGYLVNPEDVTGLADSINKALSGDLKAMGQRSYEIISGYTYEEMAKRHIEIFEIFED